MNSKNNSTFLPLSQKDIDFWEEEAKKYVDWLDNIVVLDTDDNSLADVEGSAKL